ncbi:IS3 family transposase [Deinococcus sp. QL22]|uniref:IS3 family transposase n=1 Tax=Deinococcus sp. QL22 TaxID=2939437 RepID=UPI0035303676
MCRMLEVTVSGFHTWRRRPPSARSVQDTVLTSQIRVVFQEHHGRYGAPRIQATLRRAGTVCSEKRVSRLMCA